METVDADYTQTFRDLGELSLEDLRSGSIPESAWGLYQCTRNKELTDWIKEYVAILDKIEATKGPGVVVTVSSSKKHFSTGFDMM